MLPVFENDESFDSIYSRFFSSARSLMLEHELVFDHFPDAPRQITSLELYLYCNAWADPNTDKHSEQQNFGTWYVRRRGHNANTSRLDITAGSRADKIHCGLLVRGIDGSDGSGKSIKQILRGTNVSALLWSQEEIEALNRIHGSDVTTGQLRLVRRDRPLTGVLHGKSRVGLRHPEAPWNQNLRITLEACNSVSK